MFNNPHLDRAALCLGMTIGALERAYDEPCDSDHGLDYHENIWVEELLGKLRFAAEVMRHKPDGNEEDQ